MALLRYLSHPQVRIQPDVPVPDWSLSDQGRARIQAVAVAPWLARTTRIVSSGETKARQTAAILGAAIHLQPQADWQLNEIDRSATGYVPHDRHEALADAFFAHPDLSIEGWERASDVAARYGRAAPPCGRAGSGRSAAGGTWRHRHDDLVRAGRIDA